MRQYGNSIHIALRMRAHNSPLLLGNVPSTNESLSLSLTESLSLLSHYSLLLLRS